MRELLIVTNFCYIINVIHTMPINNIKNNTKNNTNIIHKHEYEIEPFILIFIILGFGIFLYLYTSKYNCC